jgi:hypothetical protein
LTPGASGLDGRGVTIEDADGGRGQEWRAVLGAWGPPHQEGDRFGPPMSALLRLAADEPALRGLFPWTSMNELHVSATGDFRDHGSEPFPAIAASTSGFMVMEHPWGRDHVVLRTSDPAVALACLVRLVEAADHLPGRRAPGEA